MADCLISNWKGKSTKTLYENEIRKKNTGDFLDRLLVFADPVVFFVPSRQSSSVYSWLPLCWQPSFSKGKAVRQMRNKTRKLEQFVVLSVAATVLRWRRACRRLFSRLLTTTRKETKTSMLQHKKKDLDPLVCTCCSCIAEQFLTSCWVPASCKPT